MSDVLADYVSRVMYQDATLVEQRIRILLRPKPSWFPEFLWWRLLGRLLAVEHGPA